MSAPPLVSIDALSVTFAAAGGNIAALSDLTLAIDTHERVALLGESGSGKTVTTRAIAGLLPEEARVSGTLTWPALGRAPIAGRDFGMVFQDPGSSLNPVLTIREQIAEVLEVHAGITRVQAGTRAIELLAQVGIAAASRRVNGYPHEFSGGQRQRIAIAIAIAAGPRLLIADEPTSSLDTIVQAQIIKLLDTIARRHEMALLLVTHDLALAASAATRMAVMYAGRLVEVAPTRAMIDAPRHPYSRALRAANLDFAAPQRGLLAEIPGALPGPGETLVGCVFAPRCGQAMAVCREQVPPWTGTLTQGVACWLHSAQTVAP